MHVKRCKYTINEQEQKQQSAEATAYCKKTCTCIGSCRSSFYALIWVDAVSAMDVDAPDMNFEDLEDDSDGGDSNNDSQLAPRAQVSG